MRFVVAALTAAATLCSSLSAQAEKRVFIIANNSDGYGIDRCLADGSTCGNAAANAYCKSREFAQAVDRSATDRAVVKAVYDIAAASGLNVVAEGVETELQRTILHSINPASLGQGWLFAKAKIVAEPSGAASVAAAFAADPPFTGPAVAIISGGNLAPEDLLKYAH